MSSSNDIAEIGITMPTGPLEKGAKALEALNPAAAKAEKASDKLEKQTTKTNTVFGKIARSGGIVNTVFSKIALGVKKLVSGFAGLVTGAIATFGFASMISGARELSAALGELSTLLPVGSKRLGEMQAAARAMADEFGTNAAFQLKAFYGAVSAGASTTAKAVAVVSQANKLAIGGITDVSVGVDILTTATNAYAAAGLKASSASDALFVGMKAGKTTIGELASGLGNVIPIAASLGVKFDELVAGTAALTLQGLSTATAITSLRAILSGIAKPTSEAAKMAEKLGIDFSTTALRSKGLAGFLQDVVEKSGGSADKLSILFGSVEALNAALAFAGQGGVSFNEILDDMTGKAGATDAAVGQVAVGLDKRWGDVLQRVTNLAVDFGYVLLSVIVPAAEKTVKAFELVAQNADFLMISLGLLSTRYIPSLVAGLVSTVLWLTSVEGLFIAGAIASKSLAIAMNLIPGVAIFTATAAVLTGLYRGFTNAKEGAEKYATAMASLFDVQSKLNVATQNYYDNMTKSNLDAMKAQASRVRDVTQSALEAAQQELDAAKLLHGILWLGIGTSEKERDAAGRVEMLNNALMEAETRLSAADHAAANFSSTTGTTTDKTDSLAVSLETIATQTYSAIPALEELQEKYGASAEAIRGVLQAQNDLAAFDAQKNLLDTATAAYELASNVETSAENTTNLNFALYDLVSANGLSSQAQAAANVASEIAIAAGGVENMDDVTRAAYQSFLNAAEGAAAVAQQTEIARASTTSLGATIAALAPQFAPAIAAANSLSTALSGVLGQLGGIAKGLASISPVGKAVVGSITSLGGVFKTITAKGLPAASEAFKDVGNTLKGLWGETQKSNASVETLGNYLNDKFTPAAVKGGGGASSLAKGLTDAEKAAADLKKEMEQPLVTAIEGVSSAFGDFVSSGFKDFKGFVKNVLSSFQSMISQMIAMAAKNKIMLSVGLSGTAAAGGANASTTAGGGLLSSITGGIGKLAGAAGTGFMSAAGGLVSGGLGGMTTAIGAQVSAATAAGASMASAAAAIGAVAVPVLAVVAAFSFFKKSVKELDAGLRVTTTGVDTMVDTFKIMETKRFWGLSKKVSTEYDAASSDVANPIQSAINSIGETVTGLSDVLGLASDNLANAKFEFEISTKDKSDAEIQTAITAEMEKLGNSFADAVIGSYSEFLPDTAEIARIEDKIKNTFNIGGRGGEDRGVVERANLETQKIAAQTAIEVVHLNDALAGLQMEGEGSLAMLQRIVTNLQTVNERMYLFDQTALELSVDGAKAATALIELRGGLDVFTANTQFVFEKMLTNTAQQARLTEIATEKLNTTLGKLGITIPETHAEFMTMLNSQDLMTESGRNTHAALLEVASAFVQVNGTAQQAADSLLAKAALDRQAASDIAAQQVDNARQILQNRITMTDAAMLDAEAALQRAINAEKTRLTEAYQDQINAANASTTAANASAVAASAIASDRVALRRSIYEALNSAANNRQPVTTAQQEFQLSNATEFLRSALNAGGTDDIDRLENALTAVANPSTDLFDSFEDYTHSFNVNSATINDLKEVSSNALTVEQRIYDGIKSQSSLISSSNAQQIKAIEVARDSELFALDSQLNALLGIDDSVMTVADAIANFNDAKKAVADAASPTTPSSLQFQTGSFGAQLDEIYKTELGRGVKQGGLDFYGGLYVDGLSLDAIRKDIASSPEAKLFKETSVPRYHTGGLGGFAPDEYSATLLKNEEVLPVYDPRHRNNFNGFNNNVENDNSELISKIDELIEISKKEEAYLKNVDFSTRRTKEIAETQYEDAE